MERTPKKWQRRGIFALVSQRETGDLLGAYQNASRDREDPDSPDEEEPIE